MSRNSRGVFVPHKLALGAQPQYQPEFSPDIPAPRVVSERNRSTQHRQNISEGMRRINARRGRGGARRGARRSGGASIPRNLFRVLDQQMVRISMQGPTYNADTSGLLQAIRAFDFTTSAEFNNWAVLYDEWKMMGGEIVFNQLVNPTSSSFNYANSLHMVYDTDDATLVLTSYSASESYRARKVVNTGTTSQALPKFAWKNKPMPQGHTWLSSATYVWPGSLKFYGAAFAASQLVCTYQLNVFCVFRQRRLQ